MPDKATEALSLKDIVQFELPALLRRQHLNRDMAYAIIGDRGDGKSISAGVISLLDYMLQGEPCGANAQLKATFEVDDETAGKYGLKGGQAIFEAERLNIAKLLYTSTYDDYCGLFFIDEFNIDVADARRSMSNQNLAASDFAQQLRKAKSALITTCIHEMFLDLRVRDIIDVFILTKDTALTPEGLANKQKQGIEFEWEIYPMSRKLTGEAYAKTGKTVTAMLNGGVWWGVIDTEERQKRIRHKITDTSDIKGEIEMAEAPHITREKRDWGWLHEAIIALHNQGRTEIHNEDLKEHLRIEERGIHPITLGKKLGELGVIKSAPLRVGGFNYIIPRFDLKRGIDLPDPDREAVLV